MKQVIIVTAVIALISGCTTNPEITRMHYETEQKRFETVKALEQSRAAVAAAAITTPQDTTILEIVATPGKSINIDAQSIKLRLPPGLVGGNQHASYNTNNQVNLAPTAQYVEQVHPGWQVASNAIGVLSPILGVWATLKGAQGIATAVGNSNTAIANSGFASNQSISAAGFNTATVGMNNLTTVGQAGITGVQSTASTAITNMNTLGQAGVTGVQSTSSTAVTNLNNLGQAGITAVGAATPKTCTVNSTTGVLTCI